MIIYVDENVPLKITRRLRLEGYQVEYVTRTVKDREILEEACLKNALLITSDKDFERIVLGELKPTAGVVLLRISTRVPIEHRAEIVANVIRKYEPQLRSNFTTVTESAIEIRKPLSRG